MFYEKLIDYPKNIYFPLWKNLIFLQIETKNVWTILTASNKMLIAPDIPFIISTI